MRNRDGEHRIDYFREYGSYGEFVRQPIHPKNVAHNSAGLFAADGSGPNRPEWYGNVPNLPALETMLLEGWAEGADACRELARELSIPGVTSIRRRPRWGDEGDSLSLDRVYSGQLDTAWRAMERAHCPGTQIVRLWAGIAMLGDRSSQDFLWRGATALALTDALEGAGYRVELWAYAWSDKCFERSNGARYGQAAALVPVKHPDQPLDLELLAMALAHPATFRVGGFCNRLSAPLLVRRGLGQTVYSRELPWVEPEDLVIQGERWNRDVAEGELRAQLERFGGR